MDIYGISCAGWLQGISNQTGLVVRNCGDTLEHGSWWVVIYGQFRPAGHVELENGLDDGHDSHDVHGSSSDQDGDGVLDMNEHDDWKDEADYDSEG
jgi:hypothetical protein